MSPHAEPPLPLVSWACFRVDIVPPRKWGPRADVRLPLCCRTSPAGRAVWAISLQVALLVLRWVFGAVFLSEGGLWLSGMVCAGRDSPSGEGFAPAKS